MTTSRTALGITRSVHRSGCPGKFGLEMKQAYGTKDVNHELTYRNLGRTCELHVQEYADGMLSFGFSGKVKLRQTARDRLKRWIRHVWDLLR